MCQNAYKIQNLRLVGIFHWYSFTCLSKFVTLASKPDNIFPISAHQILASHRGLLLSFLHDDIQNFQCALTSKSREGRNITADTLCIMHNTITTTSYVCTVTYFKILLLWCEIEMIESYSSAYSKLLLSSQVHCSKSRQIPVMCYILPVCNPIRRWNVSSGR